VFGDDGGGVGDVSPRCPSSGGEMRMNTGSAHCSFGGVSMDVGMGAAAAQSSCFSVVGVIGSDKLPSSSVLLKVVCTAADSGVVGLVVGREGRGDGCRLLANCRLRIRRSRSRRCSR